MSILYVALISTFNTIHYSSFFIGKRLCSLHAESLRLLSVVSGEVPRILKSSKSFQVEENLVHCTVETSIYRVPHRIISERLHCDSHQQHQFLHLGPWSFHHPGGERPPSGRHQHCGRLCPLLGKGTAHTDILSTETIFLTWDLTLILISTLSGACSLLYSLRRSPGSELPAGLHRVGPATPHCLSVCLPGGSLLPVCLWDRGRRSLPLLCHWHKVQWWKPRTRVLHGQGLNGERIVCVKGIQRLTSDGATNNNSVRAHFSAPVSCKNHLKEQIQS